MYQDKAILSERKEKGQEPPKIVEDRSAMNTLDNVPDDDISIATTIEKGRTLGEVSAGALGASGDEGECDQIDALAATPEAVPSQSERAGNPSSHPQTPPENTFRMKMNNQLLYGTKDRMFDRRTARKLLERIHGHLVVFPVDWLCKEVESNNWFYNVDRLPPIDIYD